MFLARVEGNVVATRKHPSLAGWRLVICQPINAAGDPEGAPQVAIDGQGAGMHQRVVISSDGMAARKAVGDDKSPVRWMVIGVVDEQENPKAETRNPKEARRAKPEMTHRTSAVPSGFGFRISLGFRIWDFGFAPT